MTLQDEIAKIKEDLTATQGDVSTMAAGIDTLNQKIATLQGSLGQDTLSPASQAALDDLLATADQLKVAADEATTKIPTVT